MKDTRKELFHTYVEVKTEKISYPYLEKYKIREADADIIEGQKRAATARVGISKIPTQEWSVFSIFWGGPKYGRSPQ